MGWTSLNKPSYETKKEFFVSEFAYSDAEGRSSKVLDVRSKGSVCYLAIERTRTDGSKSVEAVVCLTSTDKRNFYNFSYKDMHESMGPFYYDCPKAILDLLTPTDSEYANKWRTKCRERLAASKKAKVKMGDTIVFENELRFGKYGSSKTFTRIHPTKNHYSSPDVACVVRLTKKNLLDHNYSVVK